MSDNRKLRVFLCHSSQDKPVVRDLYHRLLTESWIEPWLDDEKLLPGQDWDMEIDVAVNSADAVIICFSSNSVTKEGYVQKEIRKVLDKAEEKPEQTIFIIPLRLDEISIPLRLRKWQYIDYFPLENRNPAYERLLRSLRIRLSQIINGEVIVQREEQQSSSFLIEILLISLFVGLLSGLIAWVITIGICPPLGSLPGGFFASYWFLLRRKDIPREEGLKFGKYIGLATGIPSILIYAIHIFNTSNILQASENVYAAQNIYAFGLGIFFVVCTSVPVSVGLGWLGGWLGSHYFASKWK